MRRFRFLGQAGWVLAVLVLLGGLLVAGFLFLPPVERLQGALTQTPWMTVEVVKGQGSPIPFADRDDPSSLYLVYTHGDGRGIRVRLDTREVAPIRYHDEGQIPARVTPYDLGGPHLFNVTPLKWQFSGDVETREVYHLFGFPWANAPMTRKAQLRKGVWRLTDTRNGQVMEILRIHVRNSERRENGFGELYVSLDSRWIVYLDASFSSKVYVFRRDPPGASS